MKYRIRDTKTNALLGGDFYLSQTGSICTMACADSFPDLKAEMEVADGFYEGDYVLAYDEIDNPYVYLITGTHELLSVDNDYSSTLLYPQCLVGNYEVIKCR